MLRHLGQVVPTGRGGWPGLINHASLRSRNQGLQLTLLPTGALSGSGCGWQAGLAASRFCKEAQHGFGPLLFSKEYSGFWSPEGK